MDKLAGTSCGTSQESIIFTDDWFDDIIGQIYDCALDPDLWNQVLINIRTSLRFANATVDVIDLGKGTYRFARLVGFSPLLNSGITDYLPHVLQVQQAARQEYLRWPLNEPWIALENGFYSRFGSNPFVQLLEKHGMADGTVLVLMRDNTRLGTITMGRHHSAGPVDDAVRRILKRLLPHLRRAMVITDLLDASRVEVEISRETLDAINAAVIAVLEDGHILRSNKAATRALNQGVLIRSQAGKLQAVSKHADGLLQTAIRRSVAEENGDQFGIGVPLTGRDDDAVAHILPLNRTQTLQNRGEPAAVMIFIRPRSFGSNPPIEAISALYALTPAEGKVLEQVAAGNTVEQIAAELDISTNTVRTHLARLFSKTQTTRQADLIHLVYRLTPPAG